jgi:putative transposase
MVGPAGKREGVAPLQAAMGLSERGACSIVALSHRGRRRTCRRNPKAHRTAASLLKKGLFSDVSGAPKAA